ncbi:MAG: SURF1 family protein [Halomonas sp.]|nr:SURF1 family protein [Halomonas sp.]
MVPFSSNKPDRGVKRHFLWWLIWLSIVVLGLVLGGWQWQRAEAKRTYLAAIATAPVLDMPERLPMGGPPEGAHIRLRGEFQPEATRFLDNRTRQGRVGVAVLTPFRDVRGRWWLIERGFVATGPERTDPVVSTPAGRVEVSGVWQAAGEAPPLFGPNREGRRLQRIELTAWQGVPRFAYAGWVHQVKGPGAFAAWWTPNVMPPSRHVGYALQWWSLAVAAGVVMWLGRPRPVGRSAA